MKEFKEATIGKSKYLVLACSVMGEGKIENQDSFLIAQNGASLSLILADGLGSAPFSAEGSQKIVRITNDELNNSNTEDLHLRIKDKWKNSVKSDFDKYDTTIKFIHFFEDYALYGGVGDGWITGINSKNELVNLEREHTFSNQTDTILSIGLNEKFTIQTTDVLGDSIYLIATDGFSEDIDKTDIKGFLKTIKDEILNDPEKFLNELEESLKDWPVKSNKDDKTVLIAVRKDN